MPQLIQSWIGIHAGSVRLRITLHHLETIDPAEAFHVVLHQDAKRRRDWRNQTPLPSREWRRSLRFLRQWQGHETEGRYP